MGKRTLTGDTVIVVGRAISLREYRAWFQDATGRELPGREFQPWLNTQAGKTLDDAICAYLYETRRKCMEEILSEERFRMLSGQDKAFLLAFDRALEALGYDFGGGIGDGYCWGKYMIVYSRTGSKNKKVIARIYIRDDGIVLRLFLDHIDRHGAYLENAAEHIKAVFTGTHGNCSCSPKKENCRMRKTYELDGRYFEKCSGVVFAFVEPSMEKLSDYVGLLREFCPV